MSELMENSIMITIAIGAVSGVFSAAALWLLKYLFTDHFLPFYQAAIYKGSSIQGTWVAYTYEEAERKEAFSTIIVEQFAHTIKATYTMHFSNSEHLVFECEGEYWEGYLSIRGRSNLNTNYNILTALLRQRDNGAVLRGDVCFRHRSEDKPITVIDLGFERQN
jgi:hypothetical protein